MGMARGLERGHADTCPSAQIGESRLGKHRRVIVAVRGDTHAGHSGGLCNPETQLPELDISPDGQVIIAAWNPVSLRPVQARLWEWHEQDRGEIEALAGRDDLILFEMGDLTQGVKYLDDLDKPSISEQVFGGMWNLAPWLEMKSFRGAFLVNGTGSHTWGPDGSESLLTMLLKQRYKGRRIDIVQHWLLSVGGFRFDVAHHGAGAGIRAWLRGNVFDLYLKSILMDCLMNGTERPDMVLRAHVHTPTKGVGRLQSGGQVWELPGWISGPYCFIGGHGQQAAKSPGGMTISMMAFEIVDGRLLETHQFTRSVDLRVKEAI